MDDEQAKGYTLEKKAANLDMRFIQVRAGNWRSSDKHYWSGCLYIYMDVSENSGTPKSSILIGFSINKPSILGYLYFGNTHIQYIQKNETNI